MSDDRQNNPDGAMTPDAANVIGKARRSFAFSMLILIGGLVAVAGALFYRLGPGASNGIEIDSISVPAGMTLIAASAEKGLVTLTLEGADGRMIRVVDSRSGETVRDIAIVSE